MPSRREVETRQDEASATLVDFARIPGVRTVRFGLDLRVVDGPAAGRPLEASLPNGALPPPARVWRDVLDGQPQRFELLTLAGGQRYLAVAAPVFDDDEDVVNGGILVTFVAAQHDPGQRDRSQEAEPGDFPAEIVTRHAPDGTVPEELEVRLAQQSAIAALGERALSGMPVTDLLNEAAQVISRTLDVDIVVIVQFEPGQPHGYVGAVVGADAIRGTPIVVPAETRLESHRRLARGPMVFLDLAEGPPGVFADPLMALGVRSGAMVALGRADSGMVCAYSKQRRTFTTGDTNAMQTIAHILAAAVAARTAEDRARHDAMHDPLTGLPNRVLFRDRLTQALARTGRGGGQLAVLMLDVDRFNLINDSHGHEFGDTLLREIAPRLLKAVDSRSTVARLGGDEFAVLLEDLADEVEAQELAERLGACFLRPFVLDGDHLFVSASIGVAGSTDGADADGLIRDADAAMYRAKDAGRGRYELFDGGMRSRAVVRLQVENELRRALDRDQLRLVFQPIVDVATGRIVSCEALVRWEHPQRGLVGPDQFIAVAEESDLIVTLGNWVLRRACRQLARIRGHDHEARDLRMTVNLSARQVLHADLVPMVEEAIAEAGLEPDDIGLEITERVLLDDDARATESLRRLKRLGVRLIIDDFGTGYSSLVYLKRHPVSVLKIDRSFVAGIDDQTSGDLAIVTAIVRMADALGIDVIPEGVETQEQLQHLRDLGCSVAQGFLLGRPMSSMQLRDLVIASG